MARRIFDLADIWARRTGYEVRLVSANDHVHSRRSAHYDGLAVDLHSTAPAALAAAMRTLGYVVFWNVPGHYSHVHVEAGAAAVGMVRSRITALRLPPRAQPRRPSPGLSAPARNP